jgi:hydrogenase maturation protease
MKPKPARASVRFLNASAPDLEAMQEVASPIPTLVIGLGSHHGADAIGWFTARALKRLDSTSTVAEAASAIDILDLMQQRSRLIVCDGCRGAGRPGSIHHWRWPHVELRLLKSSGTHDLSLDEVLRLAEMLGKLPRHIDLWGIEIPADLSAADRYWQAKVASRAAAKIHADLNHA